MTEKNRKPLLRVVCCLVLAGLLSACSQKPRPVSARVANAIYAQPFKKAVKKRVVAVASRPVRARRPYNGSCTCPYDRDRAGRQCGARSAYSRARGYHPTCYR